MLQECEARGRTCTACFQGFHLDDNECVPDEPVVCKPGFWNDDDECKECKVEHCKVCYQPEGACCSECMRGYILEDNQC